MQEYSPLHNKSLTIKYKTDKFIFFFNTDEIEDRFIYNQPYVVCRYALQ